jgi:hypothetical protein
MTVPPIVLYPGARRPRRRPPPIPDADGTDIREPLARAAEAAGIPLRLGLACAIAEGGLSPRAERWGRFTREAKEALAARDTDRLQQIIDRTWPDVSFGYAQRIVKYHWVGNRSNALENVLKVRQYVFEHPEEDLQQMSSWLARTLAEARKHDLSKLGGDELLGALVVYNAGHFPKPDEDYWQSHAGNVVNYRRALQRARELLNE